MPSMNLFDSEYMHCNACDIWRLYARNNARRYYQTTECRQLTQKTTGIIQFLQCNLFLLTLLVHLIHEQLACAYHQLLKRMISLFLLPNSLLLIESSAVIPDLSLAAGLHSDPAKPDHGRSEGPEEASLVGCKPIHCRPR